MQCAHGGLVSQATPFSAEKGVACDTNLGEGLPHHFKGALGYPPFYPLPPHPGYIDVRLALSSHVPGSSVPSGGSSPPPAAPP